MLVSTNPTCRRNHETVKLCSSLPLLSEGVRNRPIPVTHLISCVYLLLFPCLNCSLFPTDIDYPDDEITDAPITSFDFSDWLFDFLDISKWIWFAQCALAQPSHWTPFAFLTAPDVCSPNPCFHGGTCVTKSPSEFTCACVEPYTGKRCQKGSSGYIGSEGKICFSASFDLQSSVIAKCAKKKKKFIS